MAGAGTTQAGKGPLPGQYMEFELPIKEDVKDDDGSDKETLYCKEPIGIFLGLTPAKARVGTFSDKAKTGAEAGAKATNAGKTFALRARKGSQSYKIILKPGTKINTQKVGTTNKISYTPTTIGISVSNKITVAEMREFLLTKSNVLAFVTPRGVTYTLQGTLGTKVPGVDKKTTS